MRVKNKFRSESLTVKHEHLLCKKYLFILYKVSFKLKEKGYIKAN